MELHVQEFMQDMEYSLTPPHRPQQLCQSGTSPHVSNPVKLGGLSPYNLGLAPSHEGKGPGDLWYVQPSGGLHLHGPLVN